MDQDIVDIFFNFNTEWAAYQRGDGNTRFHRFFSKKGITNHKRLPTRDNSIVIGAPGNSFTTSNTYIVKYPSNGFYIGPLKGELRHGFGYRAYADPELIYAGEYLNNLKNGKGKLWSCSEKRWVFDGNWADDCKNGYGEMWKKGVTYKGNWAHDKLDGIGRMDWPSGQNFQGSFSKDLRNGEGTMVYPNGDQYVGMWRNGRPHGKGMYQWKSGEVYDGPWEDGIMNGEGAIDYGIPVKGMGSMRMGSVNELNFQLQRKDDWEQGVNKSSMFIKSYRETILPEHMKRNLKAERTSEVGIAGFDGKPVPANIDYSIGPSKIGNSGASYNANNYGYGSNVESATYTTGGNFKLGPGDYKVTTGGDYKVATIDNDLKFSTGTPQYNLGGGEYKVTTTTSDYRVGGGEYRLGGGEFNNTGGYKVTTGEGYTLNTAGVQNVGGVASTETTTYKTFTTGPVEIKRVEMY